MVLFVQSLPANVTLNGASVEVHGGKTLGDALSASGIKAQPGDLLAVDGSVLEAGKGEPFDATVNGEKVTELDTKLASGDVVEIGNGGPIEEPSDSVERPESQVAQEGNGAIHLVEGEVTAFCHEDRKVSRSRPSRSYKSPATSCDATYRPTWATTR